eukprot:scaffold406_cov391-Prasinococcus_capsulatus_cf.AAC.4
MAGEDKPVEPCSPSGQGEKARDRWSSRITFLLAVRTGLSHSNNSSRALCPGRTDSNWMCHCAYAGLCCCPARLLDPRWVLGTCGGSPTCATSMEAGPSSCRTSVRSSPWAFPFW